MLEKLGLIVIRPPDGGIIVIRPNPTPTPPPDGSQPPDWSGSDNDNGDNGDNDGDNGDNDEDNGDNDEDNHDNDNSSPDPIYVDRIVQAPPPAPPDALSKCLAPGEQLIGAFRVGTLTVTAYSGDLLIELARIDRSAVPLPPYPLVEPAIIQVNASACSTGVPFAALPVEVNITLDYTEEFAATADSSRFSMYYYDFASGQWSPAPKQLSAPENQVIAASVTGLGVYAIVQQP